MNVILFHHGQGLTPGVLAFADTLRAGGHVVHTPDLYEGRTFATLEEGVAHRDALGIAEIAGRAMAAVEHLPTDAVYAGFSLGAGPAQLLAQTRPGARGALLMHGCLPIEAFGSWPEGVPLAVHGAQDDPWFEPELAAAVAAEAGGTVHLYPGKAHLFADPSTADHDPQLAAELTASVLAWLAALSDHAAAAQE
ncbi:MAG: dienelactone hydrolase family protein [Kineosporiaceae bacterium]